MRTLSLHESGLSTGQVSLSELLAGNLDLNGTSNLDLSDLIEETCHGGWPADRTKPWQQAQANLADYCHEIAAAEMRQIDGVRRDAVRVRALMQSLARHTSTQAPLVTLARDASSRPLSIDTVTAYIEALERLMVLEPLPSWSPVLRSRARVRLAAKHHFVDPAMSASLLGAGPSELRRDLKTFGLLFESLAMRDLRVYAQFNNASLHHYLDSTGLEVDAVVDGGFGRWGAIAIKLGGAQSVLDQAAKNLMAFANKVDTQSSGEPNFLAVITAEGYAYTRPDGVAIVPLGTLAP